MKVKELLLNVPGAFNYLDKYDTETLKNKVSVYTNEQRHEDVNQCMDLEVIDYNLNGENWYLAIYTQ